ncbi:hypothetical protein Arub01_17640 [Actinomadura rubrobrunea]|uniref:P27 family phage terminase small subunit n=1 Tax=Actinomadura rubrobrunea TaxID=115335 RepID=A0A9W6PS67_9ACTN|nr:hypothetical protein [Actinomadura rubrobrunea]GLW63520.1 hypothetical protein Arub01_17640 [Actinomadura rubrobrunea]
MATEDDRKPVPALEKLGPRGTKLWNDITEEFDLRPDELQVLSAACRTLDLIAAMEAELEGQPLTVLGSQRQPVQHPLLVELRLYRTALTTYLRTLRIPDDDAEAEVTRLEEAKKYRKLTRSEAGRVAAHARWGTR